MFTVISLEGGGIRQDEVNEVMRWDTQDGMDETRVGVG